MAGARPHWRHGGFGRGYAWQAAAASSAGSSCGVTEVEFDLDGAQAVVVLQSANVLRQPGVLARRSSAPGLRQVAPDDERARRNTTGAREQPRRRSSFARLLSEAKVKPDTRSAACSYSCDVDTEASRLAPAADGGGCLVYTSPSPRDRQKCRLAASG